MVNCIGHTDWLMNIPLMFNLKDILSECSKIYIICRQYNTKLHYFCLHICISYKHCVNVLEPAFYCVWSWYICKAYKNRLKQLIHRFTDFRSNENQKALKKKNIHKRGKISIKMLLIMYGTNRKLNKNYIFESSYLLRKKKNSNGLI